MNMIAIMIAVSFSVSPIASAQQFFPSIELDCTDSEVEFELPESDISTVQCSVENPHSYSEKVELGYGSEEIQVSGPTTITVEGGE